MLTRASRPLLPLRRFLPLALVLAGPGAARANSPPSVPVLSNPSDHSGTSTTTPVFSWQPSTDPEDDRITYDIEVRDELDRLFGAVNGVSGTVTSISTQLDNGARYTWRARAVDAGGAASAFSPANTFTVLAPVDCPELTIVQGDCGCGGCPEPDHSCEPEDELHDDGSCQSNSAPGAGTALGALGLLAILRRRRR